MATSHNQYEARINGMVQFLNPAQGNMDKVSYAALRVQRQQQWSNFVQKHSMSKYAKTLK